MRGSRLTLEGNHVSIEDAREVKVTCVSSPPEYVPAEFF